MFNATRSSHVWFSKRSVSAGGRVGVLTFDLVHQCDDFLCEGSRVHRVLPVGPRMFHHGQEVEPLAADVDQVEGQLSVG